MPLCLGCAPVRSQAAAMSTPLRASDCARPASLAAVPVEAPEFAAAMAALAPFEPRPAVAAAVSGGPDSLALTFLLHDWLAERGGRSDEHTSELQSLMRISYAVFCLKKKKQYHMHQALTNR